MKIFDACFSGGLLVLDVRNDREVCGNIHSRSNCPHFSPWYLLVLPALASHKSSCPRLVRRLWILSLFPRLSVNLTAVTMYSRSFGVNVVTELIGQKVQSVCFGWLLGRKSEADLKVITQKLKCCSLWTWWSPRYGRTTDYTVQASNCSPKLTNCKLVWK